MRAGFFFRKKLQSKQWVKQELDGDSIELFYGNRL
jgi:hypothetical protein